MNNKSDHSPEIPGSGDLQNNELLLGYLFHNLDEVETRQVEDFLAKNQAGREHLELLRQSFDVPLAWDKEPPELPASLAERTINFVNDRWSSKLPHSPIAKESIGGNRAFWTRLDVLVAACLLVLIGGLSIPYIMHLRDLGFRVACENNLKEIYFGLASFQNQHKKFPNIAEVAPPPHNVAGMVVPALVESGHLPADFRYACPAAVKATPVDFKIALKMPEKKFEEYCRKYPSPYGYSLGFKDVDGKIIGPHVPTGLVASAIPIMADAPPANPLLGNSPNHNGSGQNVLFLDGSAKFFKTRNGGVNGDDIYINKNREHKCGLDLRDTVIGHCNAHPE